MLEHLTKFRNGTGSLAKVMSKKRDENTHTYTQMMKKLWKNKIKSQTLSNKKSIVFTNLLTFQKRKYTWNTHIIKSFKIKFEYHSISILANISNFIVEICSALKFIKIPSWNSIFINWSLFRFIPHYCKAFLKRRIWWMAKYSFIFFFSNSKWISLK